MAKNTQPIFYLRNVPAGTIFIVRDRMEMEFREIWYRREPDEAPRSVSHPGFVPTRHLRTLQGGPSGKPRYDSGPLDCTDPGISHGMTPVVPTTILGGQAVDAFEELLGQNSALVLPANSGV